MPFDRRASAILVCDPETEYLAVCGLELFLEAVFRGAHYFAKYRFSQRYVSFSYGLYKSPTVLESQI